MKIKYYLRGIGSGILITMLMLVLAGGMKEKLSDDEIISRAKALGMVEQQTTVLSEDMKSKPITVSNATASENKVSNNQISSNEVSSNEVSSNKGSSNKASDSAVSKNTAVLPQISTKADEAEDGQAPKSEDAKTDIKTDTKAADSTSKEVVITISSGQGSYSIAKQCEAAGLVTDAKKFDLFLGSKGYDRRLVVGSHTIQAGATEDEIGKILSSK